MPNGDIPRNTRELYFYTKGEFETLHIDVKTIKRVMWWIAGIFASSITFLIISILKGLLK